MLRVSYTEDVGASSTFKTLVDLTSSICVLKHPPKDSVAAQSQGESTSGEAISYLWFLLCKSKVWLEDLHEIKLNNQAMYNCWWTTKTN
jgi:hypothetical protein